MAVTKVLARSFKLEIETGVPDTFAVVKGINSLSFSRGKTETDTTDFDSNGRDEHMVTGRNMSISCEGFYLEDAVTGDRDEGQELVEALADKVGAASLGNFKLTSPGGTVRTFKASAEIGDVGGGNNDMASWSATLVVSGAVTVS